MKKIFTTLLLSALAVTAVQADEVTLNFADLELDNSATLTDYKVNDNISLSSTGNASWNSSYNEFRLFTTTNNGGLSVNVNNAILNGVSISCTSGYGFGAFSTMTVDGQSNSNFTADPFSWEGEATESWALTAYASGSNTNVRVQSITFTYTPEAVAETKEVGVLCSEMGVAVDASLPESGYDLDEYVNVNFVKGTNASTPAYKSAENGCFYIYNGNQIVVTANNGAKLKKIEITTSTNNFGYSGFVTADGETQTYTEDFEWVPFSWEGTAEQNVTVQNGGVSGNTRVTGITVTYETPGAGITVAKPVITPGETDNTVTITCDTPGAQIYYTLDGTEPTAEGGTLYTDVITLTSSCTVKAVAVLDGVYSSVASLDVTLKTVDNLADFLANGSEDDIITIQGPITAIEGSGSYLAIKDAKGNYAVIYNTNSDLNDALNVENGTTFTYIKAKIFVAYGDMDLYFVSPTDVGEATSGAAVEPVEMKLTDDGNDHAPYEYVVVKNVKVMKDNNYLNYWILTDDNGNDFEDAYKKFPMVEFPEDDENARYDVKGVVTPTDDEDWYQLLPLSFEKLETTGVESIEDIVEEAAGQTVYYNLNGVRVEKPVRGSVYIKVTDGKSQKVLVK